MFAFFLKGASHRLEISTPQDSQEPLGQDHDLDTEDEDRVQGKMKKYEDKIDCLMNEVGTLKSEVCKLSVEFDVLICCCFFACLF